MDRKTVVNAMRVTVALAVRVMLINVHKDAVHMEHVLLEERIFANVTLVGQEHVVTYLNVVKGKVVKMEESVSQQLEE